MFHKRLDYRVPMYNEKTVDHLIETDEEFSILLVDTRFTLISRPS